MVRFEIRSQISRDEIARLRAEGCEIDSYDITPFDGGEKAKRYRVLYPIVPKESIDG